MTVRDPQETLAQIERCATIQLIGEAQSSNAAAFSVIYSQFFNRGRTAWPKQETALTRQADSTGG
jgi:hypothetical protein